MFYILQYFSTFTSIVAEKVIPQLDTSSSDLFLCALHFSAYDSIVNGKMGSNLINVCVVGGNAVSAFLSWRLQATNACDVTLVWKSGFDAVFQYGISFKFVTSHSARGKQLIA